jgi:glycosyltransferase involved in cell wall biosynthesis
VKRVLHIGKFYPPVTGGMERVVETVCGASAGLVESCVLAMNTSRETVEETRDGIHVTRIGTIGSAGSVAIAPGFPGALSRARADLIVLHEPNPWALLSYAIVHPMPRIAIWYHSDVVRPALQYSLFYPPIARPAYRRAERYIVSSPALAGNAAALAPYRDRVRVIPFGIDASPWRGIDGPAPFVLFAGRHVAYKGVDVLLRALEGTSIRAVIAGDGPKRGEWEALAATLGLGQQVRFAGDVPDVELRALMQSCAVLALPSITRAEAFGYVQLEAMASNKPIVSTDVPSGVSWVNQHETTGLIVPAGDAGALRAALERLIGDPPLRRTLGDAGRRRVEAEFTLVRLRERLRSLYDELGLLTEPAAC